MNSKTLIHSLIAAAVGGALTSITAALADPSGFNFTTAGIQHLASVAAIGALTGVAALLKQSPIQPAPNAPQADSEPAKDHQ